MFDCAVMHAAVLGVCLALGHAGIEVCTDGDGSSLTVEGNAMPAMQSNSLFQVNVVEKKADLGWEDSPKQQKDVPHILTQEFGLTDGSTTLQNMNDEDEDKEEENDDDSIVAVKKNNIGKGRSSATRVKESRSSATKVKKKTTECAQ